MLGLLVHLVEDFQERVYPVVFYYREDGGAHGRPGVASIVRVARLGTASADLVPIGESPAIQSVESCNDTFVICLVECY